MLTVDQFARIRQLRRDGLTIRQIADQLQHSPKTILKALAHPEPPPVVSQAQPTSAPAVSKLTLLLIGGAIAVLFLCIGIPLSIAVFFLFF